MFSVTSFAGWNAKLQNIEWTPVWTSTWCCLLQNFQSTLALNSWSASHGATFRSHSGDSRIDFILTRHRDADNPKQVGLIDTSPFLPSGAHHIPMMTSLNYKCLPDNIDNVFHVRSNSNALKLSGKIRCTGKHARMG